MAFSTKTVLGVGLSAAVIGALYFASRQTQPPAAEVPAPIPLGQMAAVAQAPAAGQAAAQAGAPRKRLLFFMNPYGYPCQQQLSLLNGVADSLSKVAQVVYVKTTEPADMAQFEAFGIRALPSLVITDDTGRELTRFAPGIQTGEAVLAALSK
jgi:hypothetical protein